MKKTFYLLTVLVMFSSCTSTLQVVSTENFGRALTTIEEGLSENGYEISGMSDETQNEVSVTGTSYSYYTGYGSAMKNNYWQYREYSYIDSAENMVSYTVKYQLKQDINGDAFIQDLQVTNCSANKKYATFCGQDGIVKQNINQVANNPDKTVRVSDSGKTVLAIIGGTTVISTIALIILLIL